MVLREVAEVLEVPIGTAASHLARGKAAVAAFVELVPELENSSRKALPRSKSSGMPEIVMAEVMDFNE
jgi:hypothetical protein